MNDAFFNHIQKRYTSDDAPEVPEASLRRAFALFENVSQKRAVFSLKQVILADAMLRKAGISKKMFFEFDESAFVNLTLFENIDGFSMEGFFSGFEPNQVQFFSESQDISVPCTEGVFQIPQIDEGMYEVMFEEAGRRFWMRNVEVNAS